jgi:nicotinate phosphoribosyltransferase
MLAPRSAYLAGFTGTSHVEAARRLGIPASGTMAHSWVQSFTTESEAFAAFARVFPENTTLLVDTYETIEGVRRAAAIEPPVRAIRIDSGDLAALATRARKILNAVGRSTVKIFASGDLDEYSIAQIVASGAPVDGFGVGTELITSSDAPSLAMVYKLVELGGEGKFKLSPGKRTYPMAKQVFRRRDQDGRFCGDHVTLAHETAEGEPLLIPVIQSGRLVIELPTLDSIRGRCREQLGALPARLAGLDARPNYAITYSDALEAHAGRLMNY